MSQLISHVGIAVTDLDAAIERYRQLLRCDPHQVASVPDQKVKVAVFLPQKGEDGPGGRVELLQATSPDSPIARFISKRGEGLHHVCFYVDDIEARLAVLKAQGVKLIDETPRMGVEGHLIAFIHPFGARGVLVELEQR